MGRVRRIAHILPWPNIGGIEQATLRIAQAVARKGFESIAYCIAHDDNEWTPCRRFFDAAGFETASYRFRHLSLHWPVPFLWNSWRLSRDFRRRNIDLVHCEDLLSAYHASIAGRMACRPVLCHVRNRADELIKLTRFYLRFVNHYAFVSRSTWATFPKRVPERRGTVVYDGLALPDRVHRDPLVRAAFGIAETATVIGMVARVAQQKDYPTLVRAAAQIIRYRPDVRFLCVGDHSDANTYREEYQKVRALIQQFGLDRYFVFTGNRSDAMQLLTAMDIFVLSTNQEGLPLAIIEAMAHALPVIATNVDGISEIVLDGITGLLVPKSSPASLAECVLELLRNPARAAAMGEAGRVRIAENFTEQGFAESMVALYTDALS